LGGAHFIGKRREVGCVPSTSICLSSRTIALAVSHAESALAPPKRKSVAPAKPFEGCMSPWISAGGR
jgi:hypothetical protein